MKIKEKKDKGKDKFHFSTNGNNIASQFITSSEVNLKGGRKGKTFQIK